MENLIHYCANKGIKLFVIVNKKFKQKKNITFVELNNNLKFLRTRLFSSLWGSIKLINLLCKLNKKDTKVLSMQSNFFSALVCTLLSFKISIRVSEDPCGATKYADSKIKSMIILLSKVVTYNLVEKIIVNSKKSLDCTKNFCFNKKKVKLLYNPTLKKINKFKKRKNNKIFLSVGRLCKQKNQALLINSFSNFLKKRNNYKLIIIGDGPDKIKLLTLIRKLKMTKNIKIQNWTSNLGKYYKRSSIFILTSFYEGMPNALIEALNYNIPSIATDVSGVSDLLVNGKGGAILKNFNEKDLENKLDHVTKNYRLYLKKAKISKKNLFRFKVQIASKKYLNYLNYE